MLKALFPKHLTAPPKFSIFFSLFLKQLIPFRYLVGTIALFLAMSANTNAHASKTSALKGVSDKPAKSINLPINLLIPLQVTGVVTDSTGNPFPGVTVQLKAKGTIGTTTDQNGRYILEIPESNIEGLY